MRFLKQSTSVDLPIGPFLDSTNGVDPETALTITQPDVRLKKNGGAWAQKAAAQTLSHEENGWYEVTLDATDTDTLGQLMLAVHESGALPVWHEFSVLPANVWDSLYSTDRLQTDVQEIGNDVITAAALAASAGGEIADAVWDEPRSGHTTGGTYGELMDWLKKSAFFKTGTVNDAGAGADTFLVDAGFTEATNFYTAAVLVFTSGSLAGQARQIQSYTNPLGTPRMTFTGNVFTAAPANGDAFLVFNTMAILERGTNSAETDAAASTRYDTIIAYVSQMLDGLVPVSSAVNDAAATTTSFVTLLSPAVDDFYKGMLLVFTSGALDGQGRRVLAYNGTTKAVTTEAFTSAPANGSSFVLVSDSVSLTTGERESLAAALLDLANGIETGVTLRQAQRLQLAALAGKLSGAATTTVTIRNAVADSKARITATVDADGNRTAITHDMT